jgi:hypothetical protein
MDHRMARKSYFQSLRNEKHGRTGRPGRCGIGSQHVHEASVAVCSQCSRGAGEPTHRALAASPSYNGYKAPRSQCVLSHPILQASLPAPPCRCSQVLPASGYTRRDPRSGPAMTVEITVDFYVISNLALDRGRHSRACERGGISSGTRGPASSPVVASHSGRDAIRAMAPQPGYAGCRTRSRHPGCLAPRRLFRCLSHRYPEDAGAVAYHPGPEIRPPVETVAGSDTIPTAKQPRSPIRSRLALGASEVICNAPAQRYPQVKRWPRGACSLAS